ncbi:MAG: UDP-2,3-diacylglucosamine diphosphatase [Gammaproteobacteria bacterium]|nr:UDP-2,3-diacylglucosamine diphosphatase [Gammaproteobacteria bacterium]
MTTLFVSDLHLEAGRPEIGDQFLAFLAGEASRADALYILGDLFEVWVGDDDPNTHYAVIKQALRELVDNGVTTYFMHGNRDFMIGDVFARETGVRILSDPYPVDFYGDKVLLSHGDALCIDDVQYQNARRITRDPEWQAMMLAKPLAERLTIAKHLRAESIAHGATIDQSITDVNQDEVLRVVRDHGVDVLLHGHTHRPAVHAIDLGDRVAKRIVLGDWYEQGSVVRWDESGPELCEMLRK